VLTSGGRAALSRCLSVIFSKDLLRSWTGPVDSAQGGLTMHAWREKLRKPMRGLLVVNLDWIPGERSQFLLDESCCFFLIKTTTGHHQFRPQTPASEAASVTSQCATAVRRLPRSPRTSHWAAKTLGPDHLDSHWPPDLTDSLSRPSYSPRCVGNTEERCHSNRELSLVFQVLLLGSDYPYLVLEALGYLLAG